MLEEDVHLGDKLEWEAKRLLWCWSKKEGQNVAKEIEDGEYERDSGDRINGI